MQFLKIKRQGVWGRGREGAKKEGLICDLFSRGEKALICSVRQFLWCKYSHQYVTLTTELRRVGHSRFGEPVGAGSRENDLAKNMGAESAREVRSRGSQPWALPTGPSYDILSKVILDPSQDFFMSS